MILLIWYSQNYLQSAWLYVNYESLFIMKFIIRLLSCFLWKKIFLAFILTKQIRNLNQNSYVKSDKIYSYVFGLFLMESIGLREIISQFSSDCCRNPSFLSRAKDERASGSFVKWEDGSETKEWWCLEAFIHNEKIRNCIEYDIKVRLGSLFHSQWNT